MKRIAPLTAAFLLLGCMTPRGFDRGALARAARVQQPEVTDAEIARVLALRPQLPLPFRLAVWFRPPAERWSRAPYQWRDGDREAIEGALRPLVADGIVAEIAPITDTTLAGDDLRAVRLAAARHGADAVLIVAGAGDVDRYENWASLLYLTLVGCFLVPGTHADGLFLATGTLWDVRNEFLYATAEAEAAFGKTRPIFRLKEREVLEGAKRAALPALAKEIAARMRNLRDAPRPAVGTR